MSNKMKNRSANKRKFDPGLLLCIVLLLVFVDSYAQTNNDCASCYLKGRDLSGQDFTNANFNDAILDGTNFSNCILNGANFANASLVRANFSGAKLDPSVLGPANFSGANLSYAILTGASLNGVVMEYTKLTGTDFSNADLSNTLPGLELLFFHKIDSLPKFTNTKLSCEYKRFEQVVDLSKAIFPSCENITNPEEKRGKTLPFSETVHVSTSGTDSNACGAEKSPCKTIGQGIINAKTGNVVAVDYGQYQLTSTILIDKNLHLVGGYSNNQPTQYQSAVQSPANGAPAFKVSGAGVTVEISNFIINGSVATAFNQSSTAILGSNGANLSLKNLNVNAGKGGPGAPGGNPGQEGPGGQKGADATSASGGKGGEGGGSNNAGGNGGTVSNLVDYNCQWSGIMCTTTYSSDNRDPGLAGAPGSTGSFTPGVRGGSIGFYNNASWNKAIDIPPGNGYKGNLGASGSDGGGGHESTDNLGKFVKGAWVAAVGTSGNPGGDGAGGSGGSVGGPCIGCGWAGNTVYSTGSPGGGGGGGGGGAQTPGSAGTQGGASIGIVLLEGAKLTFHPKVVIVGNSGGDGGQGGPGKPGGAGGGGGNGCTATWNCASDYTKDGSGGNGGVAGAGGASGGGSGGNGGPAICVALVNGSTCTNVPVFHNGVSGAIGNGGRGGTNSTTCNGQNGVPGKVGTVITF